MRRRVLATLAIAAAALATSAHIGDNNTHFRGSAGPYPVQVTVRHPGVVPGLADIVIRVQGDDVREVLVRPVRWDVGLEGSPRPDPAQPVASSPGLWTAHLWFMTTGSHSVHVDVRGETGAGTAVVPVVSSATRVLEMGTGRRVLLAVLGLLLAAGLVTIVRAAVREAVLEPGVAPDRRRRRRGRFAAFAAAAVLVLVLTGGRSWWRAEAGEYMATLHEPLEIRAAVRDGRLLHIALVDPDWLGGRWSPLIPDHGKLMHMFMVREPELDAFAHVHPVRVHDDSFRLAVPPLPAGRYRLYADVTHESGYAQTLTDVVELPPAAAAGEVAARTSAGDVVVEPDPDDSRWVPAQSAVVAPGAAPVARYRDGYALHWARPPRPLVVDEPVDLRFRLIAPDGEPAELAPYMGMFAHAAVRRHDGAVFVHLHPTGTVSMAAQQQLMRDQLATPANGMAGMDHARHAMGAQPARLPSGEVTMPYAFPSAGLYRVWVQVLGGGHVRTAAFDVDVRPR